MHYQLVPYLLTTGSEAFENNKSSITPLAKHNNFIEKVIYVAVLLTNIFIFAILKVIDENSMIQGALWWMKLYC